MIAFLNNLVAAAATTLAVFALLSREHFGIALSAGVAVGAVFMVVFLYHQNQRFTKTARALGLE